jgi:hypothetical protein
MSVEETNEPEFRCVFCFNTNPKDFYDPEKTGPTMRNIYSRCRKHNKCSYSLFEGILKEGKTRQYALKYVVRERAKIVSNANRKYSEKLKIQRAIALNEGEEEEEEEEEEEKSPPEPKKKVTFEEKEEKEEEEVIVPKCSKEKTLIEAFKGKCKVYGVYFAKSEHIHLVTSALHRLHEIEYITEKDGWIYYEYKGNGHFNDCLVDICKVIGVDPLISSQITMFVK